VLRVSSFRRWIDGQSHEVVTISCLLHVFVVSSYDSRIHRKLYQNDSQFRLRRYNRRIKKCPGCRKLFDIVTTKFVVAHRETYVYGRVKSTKQLLKSERDFFYHIDLDCLRHRHPYFHMCDIVMDSSAKLDSDDLEYLLSHGIFV